MHDTTRRWIVSANTGRIISYVHSIERKDSNHRLPGSTNRGTIRAIVGEWNGSSQGPFTIHHSQDQQSRSGRERSGPRTISIAPAAASDRIKS